MVSKPQNTQTISRKWQKCAQFIVLHWNVLGERRSPACRPPSAQVGKWSGWLLIRTTATTLTISVQPTVDGAGSTTLLYINTSELPVTSGQRQHPPLGHFTAASRGGAGTRRHLPRAGSGLWRQVPPWGRSGVPGVPTVPGAGSWEQPSVGHCRHFQAPSQHTVPSKNPGYTSSHGLMGYEYSRPALAI